ncbi:MAG: ATP-dependent helicase [Bacilli bacterium]|jgi:DNA helicase-2/ATP-dependent DNA helicase PcrA
MDFLNNLNEKQYEAVTSREQYIRVIAGAGSGKTRVLTYRIAFLISEIGIPSNYIWALTFTNKAAQEMKTRIIDLLKESKAKPNIMTIHSFCARFLREEIPLLNYTSNFTIFDEDDQLKLIKDIAVQHGFSRRDPIINETINYISRNKNKGKNVDDVKPNIARFPNEKDIVSIWKDYEKRLYSMNALDFDDLLLYTNEILTKYQNVKEKWQKRIHYLLVDEFQDTNNIEYSIMKKLLSNSTSFYVVGDPDQTIYTWRGANANIILQLEKEFPIKTYVLEENYRSTQNILDTANRLIANNEKRIPKNLYTNNAKGENVSFYMGFTAKKEADWILKQILATRIINKDVKYGDFAILLRANYLTLPFERAFMARQMPYQIYGGTRFYQRTEIKDALAYFRLLVNEKDDISLERICNRPPRGLSNKIVLLKEVAALKSIPLIEVFKDIDDFDVNEKNKKKILGLLEIIENTKKEIEDGERNLKEILETYLTEVGYFEYVRNMRDEVKSESMFENLMTLLADIDQFLKDNPEGTFDDYLENAALLSAQDEVEKGDYITIMTVHMAKGLEYDYIFAPCLNQYVFPNGRALDEGGKNALEEERRLCYVAFTRAKKQLFLSCNGEYNYVTKAQNEPSQFLFEAGIDVYAQKKKASIKHSTFEDADNIFEKDRSDIPMYYADENEYESTFEWQVGDNLRHKEFGFGKVIKVFPFDNIIDVDFEEYGVKKLIANHKFLKKIREEDLS